MIPKILKNIQEYEAIDFKKWNEMFTLNYFLTLEELIIRIEEVYKKNSLLSSFEIITSGTPLSIKSYDVYDEEILRNNNDLLEIISPFFNEPQILNSIKLFRIIKRSERFELYKKIIGQEFYNRIIEAWENSIVIDEETIPNQSFENITFPMYLVSLNQVNNIDYQVIKEKFFLLNSQISFLKCQQFFLVIDNLFNKNNKLKDIRFLLEENNNLKININFEEENVLLDQESASKLQQNLLDCLNLIAVKNEELVLHSVERKKSYMEAYENIFNLTKDNPSFKEYLDNLLELIKSL